MALAESMMSRFKAPSDLQPQVQRQQSIINDLHDDPERQSARPDSKVVMRKGIL